MNDHTITAIVSVIIAIVGLAILAVLVSGKAQTASVLTAGGGALNKVLCVALSPVTGGNCGGAGRVPVVTSGLCGLPGSPPCPPVDSTGSH